MEVMKQEPKLVQWTCRKGPAEWIDTEITFDLKQENDHGHENRHHVNKASSHVVAHAFINSLRNDRGLFQF
ncbi:MAG: hypothetical protein OJF51_000610 [Nitrospira sp.]|jgi:hypothetical protein|nr:MAG: hypothetical protein OJF51_000610 [Nitrospira sp.]